jgi:hypothetical protein
MHPNTKKKQQEKMKKKTKRTKSVTDLAGYHGGEGRAQARAHQEDRRWEEHECME